MFSFVGNSVGPPSSSSSSSVANITLVDPKENQDFNFEDVIGMDNEIEILRNRLIRAPLQSKMKAPLVQTVLLYGPAGTGKSKLARTVATEFARSHRSPSYLFFLSKRALIFHLNTGVILGNGVGESLAKVSLLFQQISQHRPAVLIIDDIDPLLTSQSSSSNTDSGIVAAHVGWCIENHLQPGSHLVVFVTRSCDFSTIPIKFQLSIPCYPLDSRGRQKMLEVYAAKWSLEFCPNSMVLTKAVARTRGFSQARLVDFVNQLVSRQFFSARTHPPAKWDEIIDSLLLSPARPSPVAPGSSAYKVLRAPHQFAPLVSRNVDALLKSVKMIRERGKSKGGIRFQNLLYVHPPDLKPRLRSSYESLLNDIIVPLVLEHPSLRELPSFVINDDEMLGRRGGATIPALLALMREASMLRKPSVLLIQNFPSVLARVCKSREDYNLVADALNSSAPQVFIMLTSPWSYDRLPNVIRDAIQGLSNCQVLPVSEEERAAFMEEAFDVQMVIHRRNGQTRGNPANNFGIDADAEEEDELLFQRAVDIAQVLSLEDLKDFQAKVRNARSLPMGVNGCLEMLKQVIETMEDSVGGPIINPSNVTTTTAEEDAISEAGEKRSGDSAAAADMSTTHPRKRRPRS